MLSSTVAAISTAPMKAGVALIRISGSQTKELIARIFFRPDGSPRSELPPRVACYGLIRDGEQVLDDVLVTFFPAPHSYTGEDVAEISCHGGVVISRMILELCLKNGAVIAAPGEFTRRAFTSGRLSLTRAEGISRLLEAQTKQAALLSSQTARGKLSAKIEALADALLAPVASLYAAIDYPEEDMEEMSDGELDEKLEIIGKDIRRLLDTQATGKAVVEGVPVFIVGKPNVGKSTLLNKMAGEEKAIVTQIPGTTRDLLEVSVQAGRLLLRLTDTAGLRSRTEDPVEQIGIERAKQRLKEAGFGAVLALFDRSHPLDEDDRELLELLEEQSLPVIPLFTKCDLPRAAEALPEGLTPIEIHRELEELPVELIRRLEALFISDEAALSEGEVLTDLRQAEQLRLAETAISSARVALKDGLKDACGALLEEALSALYALDGRGVSEKIVSDIFSRFCVGK